MQSYSFFGIKFENLTEAAARERIAAFCDDGQTRKIFTPNASILEKARGDAYLLSMLESADLLLADGCGISLATKILHGESVERITGIDTGFWLMRYAADHSLSVFLLGGKPDVAERAKQKLEAEIADLRICGVHHGYFDTAESSFENARVIDDIRRSGADIVFVCMGFPSQERWICENAHKLPLVKVLMGLGGSLDVWAGDTRRAPAIIQKMGLEWLYRCVREPKRFSKIYLLPRFLLHAIAKTNFEKSIDK